MKINPDTRILDVCCGNGNIIAYITTELNCQSYGIDINANSINAARCSAKEKSLNIKFSKASLNKPLPFPDSYFDSLVCIESIFYCGTLARFNLFKEWNRILKTNGRLIFTDSCIISGVISDNEIAQRSIHRNVLGEYFFLPLDTQKDLIQKSGLDLFLTEDITTNNASLISKNLRLARNKRKKILKSLEQDNEFEQNQIFSKACDELYNERKSLAQYAYYITKNLNLDVA